VRLLRRHNHSLPLEGQVRASQFACASSPPLAAC
jgi:hypothetical protein